MSQRPMLIFTDRREDFDAWLVFVKLASKPVAVSPIWRIDPQRAPFLVPYLTDYGDLSLFIRGSVLYMGDVYYLLDQAKSDKFRAVYLLDGQHEVMLFRNRYCDKLTPEYVASAPVEELHSLAWAGAKENVGTLTMKTVGV